MWELLSVYTSTYESEQIKHMEGWRLRFQVGVLATQWCLLCASFMIWTLDRPNEKAWPHSNLHYVLLPPRFILLGNPLIIFQSLSHSVGSDWIPKWDSLFLALLTFCLKLRLKYNKLPLKRCILPPYILIWVLLTCIYIFSIHKFNKTLT